MGGTSAAVSVLVGISRDAVPAPPPLPPELPPPPAAPVLSPLPSVALRVAPPEPDKPAVPSVGDSPPFPERSHANQPPPGTSTRAMLKPPTRRPSVARPWRESLARCTLPAYRIHIERAAERAPEVVLDADFTRGTNSRLREIDGIGLPATGLRIGNPGIAPCPVRVGNVGLKSPDGRSWRNPHMVAHRLSRTGLALGNDPHSALPGTVDAHLERLSAVEELAARCSHTARRTVEGVPSHAPRLEIVDG